MAPFVRFLVSVLTIFISAVLFVGEAQPLSPLEREHRGLLDSGIKLMRKGEYDKALGLYHTIISQEARSTKFS